MKIPFKLLPASWGLKGRKFKEAEAYYRYVGEELDRKLNYIAFEDHKDSLQYNLDEAAIAYKYGKYDPYEYDCKVHELKKELTTEKLLEIKLKHAMISDYDYHKSIANLIADVTAKELELIRIDHEYDKITKAEYEKAKANIEKEPWIDIVDHGFDKSKGLNGVYFEFDWNDYWIQYLTMNGYSGQTEEDIVEAWFKDVCYTTHLEDQHAENSSQI